MKYKVMIVEDQTMPRELFELRIQASERFEVALSIDNAALADVYCLRVPVDLILMDVVTRGGESGLDAAERIKRTFPQIKIIIVTSMPECSYLSRAREIGVESFWYKEEQRESLLDVMERTMAGESVYPDATPELQLGLASSYKFTDRELEVLREMTGGDTNQEIADALKAKTGIALDKRKIVINDAIKNVGTYTVTCKLGYEITAPLTVKIEEA